MNPFAYIKIGIAALVGLVAVSVVSGSFYTVDEGERAVILRNGAVIATAGPGLHYKLPFVDDTRTISVQTQSLPFNQEPVYSADRQTADVTFSINYSALPDEVETIYSRYGSLTGLEEREIARQARQQIKNVFGSFTADTAIRERGRLNAEVYAAIAEVGAGLVRLEGLQIENINFSSAVEQAAEDRAKAEMLVQTTRQNLAREQVEAEITVTKAQADADSRLAAAESEAKAIALRGDAEANAIRAKGAALRDNPTLVALTQAERWNGTLPTTMVPGTTVPFMNMPTN